MKTCSYADAAPPVVKQNYDDDDDCIIWDRPGYHPHLISGSATAMVTSLGVFA